MTETRARRISLVAVIGILALGSVAATPAEPKQSPSVSWIPNSISEHILAGESHTLTVQFAAREALADVTVRVVPELEEFVSVTPAALGDVAKGQVIHLQVVVAPSGSTEPQAVEGVVQLRNRGNPRRTYSSPLPIRVEIDWPRIGIDGAVVFRVPPTFAVLGGSLVDAVVTPRGDTTTFADIAVSVGGDDALSTFGLLIHNQLDGQNLTEWFAENVDTNGALSSSGTFTRESLPGGAEAFISAGPVPTEYEGPPLSYAYVASPSGRLITSVTLSQDHQLDRLGYATTAARQELLRSIIEHMGFTE